MEVRIVYAGNTILINAFQHITRIVDMTRKEHLPSSIRLWDGDSIGRWDGDTPPNAVAGATP